MLKAVLFDMDGVLIDSELHWQPAQEELLDGLGLDWDTLDYKSTLGLSLRDLYDTLCTKYSLSISRELFNELYDGVAKKIYAEKSSIIKGFFEFASDLKDNGVKIALVSSSPHRWIEIVIKRFSLEKTFDTIISSDDVGGEGKPSPKIYTYTAEKIGVMPNECIVIEDSYNGVLSAKRANMYSIGFRNGFNDNQDLSPAHNEIIGFASVSYKQLSIIFNNHFNK